MVMANLRSVGSALDAGDAVDSRVVTGVLSSERFAALDRKQSYFECTQHDYKLHDFDGRYVGRGGGVAGASQPLLAGPYVPLRARRPSSPYRLARVIGKSFTAMLFGDHRFPEMLVPGQAKSQDWVQALSKACDLPSRAVDLRDRGGGCGTACASWSFLDGRPCVGVHDAKNVRVHEWEDRSQFVPRHVTEAYKYTVLEYDPERRRVMPVEYWYRRDWTTDAEILFLPARARAGQQPRFVPDVQRSCEHRDGVCHFVWIPNTPTSGIDGAADYDGLYDNFDTLDVLSSVLARGGVLNLDPTLVLKMDPDLVAMGGVQKGSDNALVVGEEGDADYLELAGTSIEAGIKLLNTKRSHCLEVASCVIPDPDKVAAGSVSKVALEVVYAPMIGQCGVLRGQYGPGLRRLLEPMLVISRRASRSRVIVYDAAGNASEERLVVELPPKVVEDPATGESKTEELEPGDGRYVDTAWGDYFLPTPEDQQKTVQTLSTATAQQPFMAVQTACETAARAFGRDAGEEWRLFSRQQAAQKQEQQAMFADTSGAMGGAVAHTMQLPGGAKISRKYAPPAPPSESGGSAEAPPSESAESGHIAITPTSAAAVVTVNEARASMGLPPMEGPDGQLSLAAYQAKFSTPIAMAANAGLGKVGATPANAPAPPPGAPPPGGPPHAGPPKPGGPPGAPPGKPASAVPPRPPPAPPRPAGPPAPKPPKPGGGNPFG